MGLGPRVLAFLAVLLVVLSWAYWITKADPVRKTPLVEAMEASLAEHPPEVLIVGNSLVGRGLDVKILGGMLGLEPDRVKILQAPGTSLPTSYALLKNRVYANGHRPRLVVVGMPVMGLFAIEWPEGQDLIRLKEQMTASEPVISRKMDGRHFLLARFQDRRAVVRDKLLDGTRDRVLRTLGLTDVEEALARVFAAENVDAEPAARVIPIVEDQAPRQDKSTNRSLQASLVPDVIALAHEFGSRVVFLRMPLRPSNRRDQQAPETLRELTPFVQERGARFLDLGGRSLEDTHFEDLLHLNRDGRRVFSRLVGKALLEIGALDEEPMALVLPRPTVARITRTGTPSPPPELPRPTEARGCRSLLVLPELKDISDGVLEERGIGALSPLRLVQGGRPLVMHELDRCAGAAYHTVQGLLFAPFGSSFEGLALEWAEELPIEDARGKEGWWIYPGTTLEIDLAEPWESSRGELEVRVVIERFGDGEGSLHIGDRQWSVAGRRRVDLVVRPDPSTTPLELRLHSSPDGAPLLLRALSVTGERLLGDALATSPPAVRVVGLKQVSTEVGNTEPPSPVTVSREWSTEKRPDLRFFALDGPITALGYEPFAKWMGALRTCSPLRVFMDGEALPVHGAYQRSVKRQAGVVAHIGDVVVASTPDGSAAAEHEFSLALDPNRRCRFVRWLYPGDRWRGKVSSRKLWTLADGVWGLKVQALAPAVTETPGELELRVFTAAEAGIEGEVLFEVVLSHDRLLGEGIERLLSDVELVPSRQGLVVELRNRGEGFLLIQSLDFIGDDSP